MAQKRENLDREWDAIYEDGELAGMERFPRGRGEGRSTSWWITEDGSIYIRNDYGYSQMSIPFKYLDVLYQRANELAIRTAEKDK